MLMSSLRSSTFLKPQALGPSEKQQMGPEAILSTRGKSFESDANNAVDYSNPSERNILKVISMR